VQRALSSFFSLGSDTTATQIAANFFYITQNPETLSKLTREIRSTFSSVEEIRLGQKLDGCEYLQAIVEETLRMSPSITGVLPREVLPGGIRVAGEFFPAGVGLSVPIYTLHHNTEYYPEPHKHIPERWLVDESSDEALKRGVAVMTPFSYGPRGCIGQRLARMELYITLARAVYLYNLEYVGGGREVAFGAGVLEYKLLDHLAAGRSGPIIQFEKVGS
jgi:cytochrome P450